MTVRTDFEELAQPAGEFAQFWRKYKYDTMLVLAALIWGSTFLVVKNSLNQTDPFTFLTMRFGIATLALLLIFGRRIARIKRRDLLAGSFIGVVLFAAYALQTVGLQFTTSSKSAFITSLYVPLVPILAFWVLSSRLSGWVLMGVVASTAGLTLLSVNENFNLEFGFGEFLTLGCAVACALHIVLVGKFAPKADAINLSVVQIGVVGLLSAVFIPLMGEPLVMPPAPVWWSALFMGVMATAVSLAIMNWAQKYISSTRATLIYALEPVFAGLLGYIAGESLSLPALLGCLLIVAGMLASER